MIVGACKPDLTVRIISAKMGEYESGFGKEGQTKEHATLARAVGVRSIFCMVTKMDTIEWDLERFNKIQSEFPCSSRIPVVTLRQGKVHSHRFFVGHQY